MKEGTYYFELNDGVIERYPQEFTSKYQCLIITKNMFLRTRHMQFADRVWRQGSRGGVKIVKDRSGDLFTMQYVTKDEELMKKFMWVKLRSERVK